MNYEEEIEKAYNDGYRSGRLGGTSVPHGYMLYQVLEKAYEDGYKDGAKARAAAEKRIARVNEQVNAKEQP